MPFDAPTKASSLSASRSGLPRVAPMLVVVQPQKRGVPRAPQLPARPATAGAFSRRLGGAAFECRGAAAAARPASALQRSRTRAARDLGEVTASLCKDLDGWLGKYQGALRAVDGLRSASEAPPPEVAPAAPRAFEERRRAELLQLLHVVEERLGLAVSQAQHTREQAIALQDVHALLHAAERGRHAADAQLAAATAERQTAARRARAEQRVLAAALAEVEAEGDADRRAAAADARDDELRRLRAELPRLREVAEREAAARFETIGLVQQANAERDAALAELAAARAAGYAPPPAAEARRVPPRERARSAAPGRRSCG